MRHRGVGRVTPALGPVAMTGDVDRTEAGSRWARDALGLAWTIAAAVLVLVPALRPRVSLGPFDLLTRFGLTRHVGVSVHNAIQADQIQQFVPWTNLAWHQVHNGNLPLWNPDNVLGMPLAFNWQSGVFSVPALVGYLFPVSFAYTALVLAKLVVAGTGAYVLCRVLRLSPLAAAFGGTAFELSGPMIVHAGWPHTSVICWAGWILAAVVGLLRGSHRLRNTTMLALAVGFAVYGGHPESLVAMGVAVVVFIVVYLVARGRSDGGPILRPLRDLLVGAVCGFGLGAPLLFPGVQLGLASVRRSGTGAPAFSLSHAPNLLAVGLQGNDFKTAAYVGVVVLALAVIGARLSWTRPHVPALAAVAVVTGLLTFVSPAGQVLHLLPEGRTVAWSRSVMLLALALAVLGATGIDALARSRRDGTALRWTAGTFGILAIGVLGLAVAAQTGLAPAIARHRASLVWPAVQSAVGLAVAGMWWWSRRPGAQTATGFRPHPRWSLMLLVAAETGFLLSAGIPSWSVGTAYFPTNLALTAVQKSVGPSLIGYGSCRSLRFLTPSNAEVGIRPNANIGYKLHVMAVYDPIIPSSYFDEWLALSGQHTPRALRQLGMFCAHITTVTEARIFGIQYILERPGRYWLPGSVPVGIAGGETLVSIPGAGEATTNPVVGSAPLPTDALGTPVPVTHPDPASWRVVMDNATASILRLRLTDVPGWQATVDGRPLPLQPWAGATMLEGRVSSGRHVVEVHYWPTAFTAGIIVGAVAAGGLVAAVSTGAVLSFRRRRNSGTMP